MKNNEVPFDESLVSAYVDRELTADEAEVVESAMQDSPELRQLAGELAAVRSLVAASAVKDVALSRSLQSAEWAAPVNKLLANHVAINNSAGVGKKHRKWLGVLASLAAACLVFLSVRHFADGVREGGMQIAMEPGFDARMRSGIKSEMESFSANEIVGLGSSEDSEDVVPLAVAAPMMAESLSAQQVAIDANLILADSMQANSMQSRVPRKALSQNAQDFVGYLTRKLNSNPSVEEGLSAEQARRQSIGQSALQWNVLVVNSEEQPDAFATQIEATDRVAASSDAAAADARASVAGSTAREHIPAEDIPAVNNILVYATESEDEIELQLPEALFPVLLAALEQDPALGDERVLVAIRSASAGKSKSANEETVRGMVTGSAMVLDDSIWRFSRFAEVSSDTLFASGDAVQRGAYGDADMLRFESLANGSSSRNSAPGSANPMMPKSRAMRSDGGMTGQVEFNDSAKTADSLGAGFEGDVPRDALLPKVEKLNRIRIKIKKEPTSSGSDE
jgi:hypothetical protein